MVQVKKKKILTEQVCAHIIIGGRQGMEVSEAVGWNVWKKYLYSHGQTFSWSLLISKKQINMAASWDQIQSKRVLLLLHKYC